MRKIKLILLFIALIIPGVYANSLSMTQVPKRAARTMAQKALHSEIIRPGILTEYRRDFWSDEVAWEERGKTTFSYDTLGNKSKETTVYSFSEDTTTSVYTYDKYNQVLTSETTRITTYNEETTTQLFRTEYTWDPIVHDFCTSVKDYYFEDDTWKISFDSWTNTVTRNKEGNVVEVVNSRYLSYLDDEMQPNTKTAWTYDSDGEANTLCCYNYDVDSNSWIGVPDMMLNDIKWNRTNGQLLSYDISDYLEGKNRIASANYYENGTVIGFLRSEYSTSDPEEYFYTAETLTNPLKRTIRKKYTDNFGSYVYTDSLISDYIDENNNRKIELIFLDKAVLNFNESGLLTRTRIEEYRYLFDEPRFKVELTENTYDENGNLTESIISEFESNDYYDENEVVLNPITRYVYGSYNDVTSNLSNVQLTKESYPSTVYNVQGIAVKTVNSESELQALPAGFYIVNGQKYIIK